MRFTDTHCHIHSHDYPLDAEQAYSTAVASDVNKMICVGTDVRDSTLAAEWAQTHENAWASCGVHPHEAKGGIKGMEQLLKNAVLAQKIVAIGEIGLDYHYMHSSKNEQIAVLEAQLQLALDYNMPVIFHVREAYEDFWATFSHFQGVKGVLHSFSDTADSLEKALAKELYIGINGIATFTKDEKQSALFTSVPLERLLLETDAPYLTPVPHRGKVNEPAYVRLVAERLSGLQSVPVETIARRSSHNATILFHI